MQLQTFSHRLVRKGLVFGLASSFALMFSVSNLSADDGEQSTPAYPAESSDVSASPDRGTTPDYWSGTYWDAQDGKSFWHRLKPKARPSQGVKADDEPRKPAINGSLRTRNENRARRR